MINAGSQKRSFVPGGLKVNLSVSSHVDSIFNLVAPGEYPFVEINSLLGVASFGLMEGNVVVFLGSALPFDEADMSVGALKVPGSSSADSNNSGGKHLFGSVLSSSHSEEGLERKKSFLSSRVPQFKLNLFCVIFSITVYILIFIGNCNYFGVLALSPSRNLVVFTFP
jgi:hypothetical protein